MAVRSPKMCAHPGCRKPTKQGLCEEHRQSRQRSDQSRRGTATERGYDYRWSKASRLYRMRHPLCRECAERGRTTPARCVDHIIPWQTGATEEERQRLFWDESNWQALCWRCHSRKTAREDGALGRRSDLFLPDVRPVVPLIVVAGPPASGKTTLVRACARERDLILDLDVIRADMTQTPLYEASIQSLTPALLARNARLKRLERSNCGYDVGWLIASSPLVEQRKHWTDRGAHVVVLLPTMEECIARVRGDAMRRDKGRHESLVREWFGKYERREHERERVITDAMNASDLARMMAGWGRDRSLADVFRKPTIHDCVRDPSITRDQLSEREVTEESPESNDEEVTGPRVRDL